MTYATKIEFLAIWSIDLGIGRHARACRQCARILVRDEVNRQLYRWQKSSNYQDEIAMQYTKSMIEQVFEIRKIAPSPLKAQIKLANPNLLDSLIAMYWEMQDKMVRERIERLMVLAGPTWLSSLRQPPDQSHKNSNMTYRGCQIQTQPKAEKSTHSSKSRNIVYRGQTIKAQ